MAKSKIIIIGGGASGLVAGIIAAREGAKVTILERKNRVGKKILATGNGRCNMTNINCNVNNFHGENPEFVSNTLNRFTVDDTLKFFEELGIMPLVKECGKVYPFSEQATAVLDVLRYEADRLKINTQCEVDVVKIESDKNFKVYDDNNNKYYGNKIIIATGGRSCPDLGSNGSGYKIAEQLGHSIITPFPSLVQLKSDASYLKQIKGVKVQALVKIFREDKKLREDEGEVLFADYGLSGPPILQLSRNAARILAKGETAIVEIDFLYKYTKKQLDDILLNRLTYMPYKDLQENFIGLLNKRLIPIIIKEANVDPSKKSSDVTKIERSQLVETLKGLRMNINGTHQWNQSQVTAGGVNCGEVDPITLESKIVKNIYFTGEVLDVDGDCGGYNLQWAWSSGFVAGIESSK